MLDFLILADDFTGALDTGVQFSSKNINTLVTSNTNIDELDIDESVKVLVIDTESRYLSDEDSYNRIYKLLIDLKKIGYRHLYKKIDSGLRGNIAPEIKAISDYHSKQSISVIASYPEMDRVVIDGKLYISGELVENSVFGKDPFEPVLESSIKNLIEKSVEKSIKNINKIEDFDYSNYEQNIYIFDGETEEDLENIYDSLYKNNSLFVSVGCAGFAKIIANKISKNSVNEINCKFDDAIVIISGSLNPITIEQVKKYKELKNRVVSLNESQLIDDNYWNNEKNCSTKLQIEESYRNRENILFETFSLIKSENGKQSDMRFKISSGLGNLTKFLIEDIGYKNFMFIGGDTLYAIMNTLNIYTIIPKYEFLPGVVLSVINYNGEEIKVASKSGGFGSDDTLIKIQEDK